MTYKHSLAIFFILIMLGIGSYAAVRQGFYPVAIVNLDVITARNVEKNYTAAFKYFKNALLVYKSDISQLEKPESKFEIKRGTLEKMILDSLIYKELKRYLKKSDFQPIAESKINQFIADNKNIEEAADKLYGLTLDEFKKRVLFPQAYREILEGRMFLENQDFNKWLENSKSAASVIILIPNLQWKDNGVKLR